MQGTIAREWQSVPQLMHTVEGNSASCAVCFANNRLIVPSAELRQEFKGRTMRNAAHSYVKGNKINNVFVSVNSEPEVGNFSSQRYLRAPDWLKTL